MLVLGAVFTMALPAACFAVCGDGIVDAGEQCDAGGNNGYDMCCSATCAGIDGDGDGVCDAIDTCRWQATARLTEIVLHASGLASPIGDERFRLTGRIWIPEHPFVDPAEAGVRFGMFSWADSIANHTVATAPLVSATIPGGGRRWRARASDGLWTYRDPRGTRGGITRIVLRRVDPDPLLGLPFPVTLAFEITGRRGRYDITPDMVAPTDFHLPIEQWTWGQIWIELGLGPAGDDPGPCDERFLPYWSSSQFACSFGRNDKTLDCSGPPPVGPCHVGEPRDVTICETEVVGRAEEAYFAEHGTYFQGPCDQLPGYVPTDPEIEGAVLSCDLSGTDTRVAVSMTNNFWPANTCYYESDRDPHLTCF